jgi:hypothetical protein
MKGIKYNRYYFQLVPSMLRIEEIEFGLLPTVVKSMGNRLPQIENGKVVNKSKKGERFGVNLHQLAVMGMLPTPTPTRREYKGGRHPDTLAMKGRSANNSLGDTINSITGQNSRLSPLFVMEMMGFPPDWTLQPFQKQSGIKAA